jgi:hypothetical protein
LSIESHKANWKPSGPLLSGANRSPISSWDFIMKSVQFSGKLLTSHFLQATVVGPILGIAFLQKFKINVAPETSQVRFSCTVAAPVTASASLCSILKHPTGTTTPSVTADTPPLPMLLVRDSQVMLSQPLNQCNGSSIDPSVSTPW